MLDDKSDLQMHKPTNVKAITFIKEICRIKIMKRKIIVGKSVDVNKRD